MNQQRICEKQCFNGVTKCISWFCDRKLFQKLTPLKMFISKRDASWNSQFKTMLSGKARKMRKPSLSRSNMIHNITLWIQTVFQNLHVFNYLIQYPTRCKNLVQFLMPFKFYAPKLCFPKRHGKCRSRRFLGVTWFILWFCEFTFFQNLTRFENF